VRTTITLTDREAAEFRAAFSEGMLSAMPPACIAKAIFMEGLRLGQKEGRFPVVQAELNLGSVGSSGERGNSKESVEVGKKIGLSARSKKVAGRKKARKI
jgi:hypothetical protein